jgi:hypothetical protein
VAREKQTQKEIEARGRLLVTTSCDTIGDGGVRVPYRTPQTHACSVEVDGGGCVIDGGTPTLLEPKRRWRDRTSPHQVM